MSDLTCFYIQHKILILFHVIVKCNIKGGGLTECDRLRLKKGYHNVPTHNYRIRCKSILLKSLGKSVSRIAEIFDVTVPIVYGG